MIKFEMTTVTEETRRALENNEDVSWGRRVREAHFPEDVLTGLRS